MLISYAFNYVVRLQAEKIVYFIRKGTQPSNVTYLLNYLNKYTDVLFPAGKEIKLEGKTNFDLQQQLLKKWFEYSKCDSEKKLIILIDGLDEGDDEILTYLPRESFDKVLIIYSTRINTKITQFINEIDIENENIIELKGLNKEAIYSLVSEYSNKYEIQEDWVNALMIRSEGNSLYLKLLCKEIDSGKIKINDIDSIPKNLREIMIKSGLSEIEVEKILNS